MKKYKLGCMCKIIFISHAAPLFLFMILQVIVNAPKKTKNQNWEKFDFIDPAQRRTICNFFDSIDRHAK